MHIIMGIPPIMHIMGMPISQHFIMAPQQAFIISMLMPGIPIILQTILSFFISQSMVIIMLMLQH